MSNMLSATPPDRYEEPYSAGYMQGYTDALLLERAKTLLPKYGGMAEGALFQAALLLGLNPSAEDFRRLAKLMEDQA